MNNRLCFAILLALAALPVSPAVAHSGGSEEPQMVQASKPETVMAALEKAGFDDAQFFPRDEENETPSIEVKWDGVSSFVLFDDCDEAVPDFCETLVLSMAWDRETPMTGDAVASANRTYPYITVWLDDEGDPYMQWAIFTGREGVPMEVFIGAHERYLGVVAEFWDVVFEDDGDEPAADAEASE